MSLRNAQRNEGIYYICGLSYRICQVSAAEAALLTIEKRDMQRSGLGRLVITRDQFLTCLEEGKDRPTGFIRAPGLQTSRGAAHKQSCRAGGRLPQCFQGNVLLSTTMAAVQEKISLLQGPTQILYSHGLTNTTLHEDTALQTQTPTMPQ